MFFGLFTRKPKKRAMYVVEQGDMQGSFLLYISEENVFDTYAFLQLPFPLKPIYLSKQDFNRFIKHKLLKYFKRVPNDVYEVSRANFIYAKKKESNEL